MVKGQLEAGKRAAIYTEFTSRPHQWSLITKRILGPIEKSIVSKLKSHFEHFKVFNHNIDPERLDLMAKRLTKTGKVVDVETHFDVLVASKQFKTKKPEKAEKMVRDILKDEINQVTGLSYLTLSPEKGVSINIETKTPEQYLKIVEDMRI